MAQVIDGKAVAAVVRAEVQARVERLRARGVVPGLATILVGADPASQVYVRNKQRMCEAVGMNSIGQRLPADVSQAELIELVRALGRRADVHGILVQLPLPRPLDSQAVIDAIDPSKDVDGLHPVNQGRLMAGLPGLRPCTPLGVMRLLREAGVSLSGARAVVVGRSVLVGKPVAQLLLEANATVTMCHSRTRDLAGEVGRAEVVVAAVGIPCMVKGAWIREGAAVVDVGINRRDDGTLCGDVEYDVAATRAGAITPVPGGVGPMTVAMLLANTVSAAESTLGASPA